MSEKSIQPLDWQSLYCGMIYDRPQRQLRWQGAAFLLHMLVFIVGIAVLWAAEHSLILTLGFSFIWVLVLVLHSSALRLKFQHLQALRHQMEREYRWQRRKSGGDDYHFVYLPDEGDLFDRPPTSIV